jgi:hypothetical protein
VTLVFLVSKLCSTFDSGLLVVRDAWNEGDGRLFDCLVGTKRHHDGTVEEKEEERKPFFRGISRRFAV